MMVVEASALNTVLRGIRRILLVKLNCRWHTVIHTTYNGHSDFNELEPILYAVIKKCRYCKSAGSTLMHLNGAIT